jgi:rare lipoprotein A
MSIACAVASRVDTKANRVRDASSVSAARVRKLIKLVAVMAGAAVLAACSQTTDVARNSQTAAASRQASPGYERTASSMMQRRVASVKKYKYTPIARKKPAAGTEIASNGVASFYTEGTKTASGEKFNTNDLTAAHPTLPFGTRLRVTNVTNGQAVTVRVNDRGPYIPGRIVDVSHSAANALGMVDSGIAKVRLDVVR